MARLAACIRAANIGEEASGSAAPPGSVIWSVLLLDVRRMINYYLSSSSPVVSQDICLSSDISNEEPQDPQLSTRSCRF